MKDQLETCEISLWENILQFIGRVETLDSGDSVSRPGVKNHTELAPSPCLGGSLWPELSREPLPRVGPSSLPFCLYAALEKSGTPDSISGCHASRDQICWYHCHSQALDNSCDRLAWSTCPRNKWLNEWMKSNKVSVMVQVIFLGVRSRAQVFLKNSLRMMGTRHSKQGFFFPKY